jgi:ribosomal protein S6--L-glutamate ligase
MKILILGGAGYTNVRLREAAKARGHVCHIKSYKNCYLSVESGDTKVYYKGKELKGYDAVIPRIAQRYTKYGTAVLRQFEMQRTYVAASSLAINRSRNKLRSMQLLAKAKVGVPKTIIANSDLETDEILNAFGKGPYIIKTTRGTHGKGVILAETKKAAKAVMQAFYVENINFMVQEFIEESAGTDIRVLVIGGRIAASIKRQSLDEDFRSNTHLGAEGTKIKLTDEEKKIARKAAKIMGLPICGVDMMRSARGPLILEVNSSASIRTPESVTGRDIATKIIQHIETSAKRGQKKDKVGA